MNRIQRVLTVAVFAILSVFAMAQQEPAEQTVESGKITWSVELKNPDTRVGETTQLIVTGNLPEGWHTYGPQLQYEDSFIPMTIKLDLDGNFATQEGELILPPAHVLKDPGFLKPVAWYEKEFRFAVPVRIVKGDGEQIQVEVRAQACDDSGCDAPRRATLGVAFSPAAGEPRPERSEPDLAEVEQTENFVMPADEESTANPEVMAAALEGISPGETGAGGAPTSEAPTDATSTEINNAKAQGLIPFLLISFVAGLLALLTPCVWPMIPITVSYFTKKAEEGPGAVMKYAIAYCLGIIGTFVGLGLVITAIFGASGVQKLAASPIANALLAILFIVLAINLFGVFEIRVPTKLVNKAQSKSKTAGFAAPILLGFVFSLTTFTCTVPFVGTILVSATSGDYLYPILGMTAFSLAFAIPFFLLAILPNGLKKMPKSGSWLNAVKSYMGFLELAAALKFVSNVDVIVNDPLMLPFQAFGAIWFAIFAVAAMYLFGIVRMPHQDGAVIGIGRKIFAFANVGIAVWLLAGITNAQILGPMVGFYPPKQSGEVSGGIVWNENRTAVEATALAEGTPIFINFTGKTCTNCRVMEYQRFPTKPYMDELNKFALMELYTDRETAEDEANAKFREELTGSATNPTYAITKPDGTLVSVYQGMAKTDADFIRWMQENYTKALQ